MGRPLLTNSFDGAFFYPKVITPLATALDIVHPNWVTFACIGCKVMVLLNTALLHPVLVLFWGVLERTLDCLDGEIARIHQKQSALGHWMDKISDLVFKLLQLAQLLHLLLERSMCSPGAAATTLVLIGAVAVPWALDLYDGAIQLDMNTPRDSRFIWIEDNGTLLVFVLPAIIGSFARDCGFGCGGGVAVAAA